MSDDDRFEEPARPAKTFQPLKRSPAPLEPEEFEPDDLDAELLEEEGFEEPEVLGKTFAPLRGAARTDSQLGELDRELLEEEGFEEPVPAGKTFEGLKPSTTYTESAVAADATPLVVEEEADAEEERTLAELKGEVRSLRSRNQILRTERTSMAGRKYALEVVLESLKEKLEALVELCDTLDAPGELGEALAGIREMVGEARAIATGKADAMEADLESERAAQLKKTQDLETRVSELSETNAGLRAERDALREHTGYAERELNKAKGWIEELERYKRDAESAIEQALEEAASSERVEQLERQVQDLQRELAGAEETLRRETAGQRAKLAQLQEQVQQSGLAEAELTRLRAEMSRVNAELTGKSDDLSRAMRQAETAQDTISRLEVERDDAVARADKQDATLAELRQALTEIKPVLDELDSENRRLSRLVGEARDRGRVDIQELLAREKLLRKLERLSQGG